MTATATGGPPAPGGTAPAGRPGGPGGPAPGRARRRPIRLPQASTTPRKIRLILAGLLISCLGWGVLAALMIGQHASAADDVVGAGSGAFTGLEAGVIGLALVMAVGCAWGLFRRLAEYR